MHTYIHTYGPAQASLHATLATRPNLSSGSDTTYAILYDAIRYYTILVYTILCYNISIIHIIIYVYMYVCIHIYIYISDARGVLGAFKHGC